MAKTERFTRPASVPEFDALKTLADRFGFDKIENFQRQGATYVATVKVADNEDDEDKDDSGSGDDKPAFLKGDDEKDEGSDEGGESKDESSDSGDSKGEAGDDDREKPPFEEGGEEDTPSLEGIFDLVKQIAEAVGVPTGDPLEGELLPGDDLGMDAPLGDPMPEAPLELPDVGAPPAGGPELPPPVPAPAPKSKGVMPSFARVAGYDEAKAKKRVFDVVRAEAGSVSNKELLSEAKVFFPDHRVAKIDRRKFGEEDRVVVTLQALSGKEHMKGVGDKRNRQYEHVLSSCKESHPDWSEDRCKEYAARTVNKTRSEKGETKD